MEFNVTADIQEIKFSLPLSFSYEGEKYYNRECYAEYYDYIMKLFNDEPVKTRPHWISVTGTPGI
jgi:hypothetical protein